MSAQLLKNEARNLTLDVHYIGYTYPFPYSPPNRIQYNAILD
jgi:hypothetical protein